MRRLRGGGHVAFLRQERRRQGHRLRPEALADAHPFSRCAASPSTFAGPDAGAQRFAATYTLIETAKRSDVDPRAWLAVSVASGPDHPAAA